MCCKFSLKNRRDTIFKPGEIKFSTGLALAITIDSVNKTNTCISYICNKLIIVISILPTYSFVNDDLATVAG